MKKFALVNGNLVINTVVAEDKPNDIPEGVFVEITELTNDAVVGAIYNSSEEKFINPQPYASWVLDTDTFIWKAPVEKPEGFYRWDESQANWVEMVN
jgi:hypothetical protein